MQAAERRDLERSLRERLVGVDLICEVDADAQEVDAAEASCRDLIDHRDFHALRVNWPATWATFVARRGAEVYEGHSLWPGLGVPSEVSPRAGDAFVSSLRTLKLPDFREYTKEQGARTFVTPALIHGGLPKQFAVRLVERLEHELRRGLVDGDEAVRRLRSDKGLALELGLPVQRLLTVAPHYTAALFDSIIGYLVEEPTPRPLPFHIRAALEEARLRGVGLRRVPAPRIEIDPWSGVGPELVVPEGGVWSVSIDGQVRWPRAGDALALPPRAKVRAKSSVRQVDLELPHEALWFHPHGRLIAPGDRLPAYPIVLAPWGARLLSDASEEVPFDELAPLSGPWSQYRLGEVDLTGVRRVSVVIADRSEDREVARSGSVRLEGPVVESVVGPNEEPIFSAAPVLEGVQDGVAVGLWFAPNRGDRRSKHVIAEGRPMQLDDLLGDGFQFGRLAVSLDGVRIPEMSLGVIPGLVLDLPKETLRPNEPCMIGLDYRCDGETRSTIVPVDASTVSVWHELPCPGRPAVRISVPRVRWAFIGTGRQRPELDSTVLTPTIEELTAPHSTLLIRCGRAGTVTLRLAIDDDIRQIVKPTTTRPVDRVEHFQLLPLAPLTTTLLAHQDRAVRLLVDLDGKEFDVARAGTLMPLSRRTPMPSALPSHPWTGGEGEPRSEYDPTILAANQHLLGKWLLQFEAPSRFVKAVQLIGVCGRQTSDPLDEASVPVTQGATLEGALEDACRIAGVRHRRFASFREPKDIVRRWMRDTAARVEAMTSSGQQDLQYWRLLNPLPEGHIAPYPAVNLLEVVRPSGSSRGRASTEYPAAALFSALDVAGGDTEATIGLRSAAVLDPELAVSTLAMLLQLLHCGHRFRPLEYVRSEEEIEGPDVKDRASGSGEDDDKRCAPAAELTLKVEVEGREIRVCGASLARPPAVRLWSIDRPVRPLAVLRATVVDGRLVGAIPVDSPRTVGVEVTQKAELGSRPPQSYEAVAILSDTLRMKRRPAERADDLQELGATSAKVAVALIDDELTSGSLASTAISDLFDRDDCGSTLAAYASSSDESTLDRLALGVLPAASLYFSPIAPRPSDQDVVWQKSTLLWAVLCARSPTAWSRIGFKNRERLDAGTSAFDDVLNFADTHARRAAHDSLALWTHRYELPDGPNMRAVRGTVSRMEHHKLPATFVDRVVVTYAGLSYDLLTREATRGLLDSYDAAPSTTRAAALTGFLLFLAAQGAPR